MPSTTETGSKPAPKRQRTQKPAEQPEQEAAPAAAAPTPPVTEPTDNALFDDATPAPPAAEQQPVEPAAPSDASGTEGQAQEGAQTEDAAEGQTAPTDPAPATPPAPEPAPEPEAPAQQDQAEGEDEGEDLVEKPAPSASPTRVRLGRIEGALHRVPLEVVQMLAAESRSRIETLQSSPSIADLQKRMRASEGRCAPIFFTMAEDQDRPYLFAGVEAIAAAINLGLGTVSVVTIAAGDAGAAQQHLATWANGRPATTQDDVLEVIE